MAHYQKIKNVFSGKKRRETAESLLKLSNKGLLIIFCFL